MEVRSAEAPEENAWPVAVEERVAVKSAVRSAVCAAGSGTARNRSILIRPPVCFAQRGRMMRPGKPTSPDGPTGLAGFSAFLGHVQPAYSSGLRLHPEEIRVAERL